MGFLEEMVQESEGVVTGNAFNTQLLGLSAEAMRCMALVLYIPLPGDDGVLAFVQEQDESHKHLLTQALDINENESLNKTHSDLHFLLIIWSAEIS